MPDLLRLRMPSPIAWARRWEAILPLLGAELIVWLGFGALLPIMPLYFTAHGVGLEMLGVVVAAWPAARLVGEPVFGWLADRTRRVPLMVAGNLGAAVFLFLPLVIVGPVPFAILRALAGLATALYDPAARGYITDCTPPDRRGEAFGMYGAAQMAGLLLGPAIGGIGSAAFGGIGFIFVFGAISSVVAAAAIAFRVTERPHAADRAHVVNLDLTELGHPEYGLDDQPGVDAELNSVASGAVPTGAGARRGAETIAAPAAPASLVNRWLAAAILFTVGTNFAFGTYEVVWSLFLARLGASVELIGLTFALFGLPILVLSPAFGRRVDRGSLTPYLLAGAVLPVVAAIAYTLIRDPVLAVPLILVESTGSAIGSPALYSVIALASPIGRASTAQGIVGATGTLGFVVASLVSGTLAAIDIRLPFYMFAVVMSVLSAAAIVVAWPRLKESRVALSVP